MYLQPQLTPQPLIPKINACILDHVITKSR